MKYLLQSHTSGASRHRELQLRKVQLMAMGLVVSPDYFPRPPEGDFKHCNWVKHGQAVNHHFLGRENLPLLPLRPSSYCEPLQSLLMMIKHIYQTGKILCRLVHGCIHKMWLQFNIAIRYDSRYFMAIRSIKQFCSLMLTILLDNLTISL